MKTVILSGLSKKDISIGRLYIIIDLFLFTTAVEICQFFHIAERLGLVDNRFMRILPGSTFDIKDIFCYGIGSALILISPSCIFPDFLYNNKSGKK